MLAAQGLNLAKLEGAWAQLPAPLRQRLGLGSTGWRRLAQTGALCLGLARLAAAGPGHGAGETARLAALAADLLLWAFGENPLHGPLAASILAEPELPLPEASRAALAAVAAHWRVPEGNAGGLAYFERLAARRDTAKLAEFLAGQVRKAPQSLFWREKALALALYAGEPEARAALEAAALDGLDDGLDGGLEAVAALAPVAAVLAAQAAFLRGDTTACLDRLAQAQLAFGPVFGPAFTPARTGLALLAANDHAAALPQLFRALAAAPWQASLALVAADAVSGLRHELAPPPGPVLIMLYTWNKAADLDATLTSLF
ncbi:MAG: hypothetical protein C0405_05965, partial [Desulfovibrio sp.]|nr:hypothetical protein [Desulfovibrio sp.]